MKFNLIVVDAGASKKIDTLATQLYHVGYKFNIIHCHKIRDISTGKIISVKVFSENLENLPCIIIDDIADGANSFIFCVKELQKIKGYKNSFLIVTHGIFSAGFVELLKYFDGIYCTNSVQDIYNEYFDGYNMKSLNGFVKQLKVI